VEVLQGLALSLSPLSLLAIFLGVFVGIIIGVVPGIGAGVGLTLLLPFLLSAPPIFGLAMLLGLWAADGYGASISSILINVPGGSGAVATCFDGYPMARKGRAGEAIGLSMGASFFGGVLGTVVLMVAAPPMAEFAVKIGPAQYTLLGLAGLTMVGGLSGGDPIKGVVAAMVGLMLSFIGYDLTTGFIRYSFGTTYLYAGIEFGLAMIGLFALSSLVEAMQEDEEEAGYRIRVKDSTFKGLLSIIKYPWATLRGSVIGTVLGVFPGIGIGVSSMMSYTIEQKVSKHPEEFGNGAPEGVIGPEAANNAVQPAHLIPALALGIPGSSTSAIFLGALMMYGFRPGMELFRNSGPLVWGMFWAIMVASIMYVIVGLAFGGFFAKITSVPIEYLLPGTIFVCFIGAYAMNGQPQAFTTILILGFVGFILRAFKYPLGPAVLGMVLGDLVESNYNRALLISDHSYSIFFQGAITWVLWALLIASVFGPIFWSQIKRITKPGRKGDSVATN
jgi:putative tricarboxylic transport membrane protein